MFGAIEAGGTKFVCAVGTAPDDLTVTQFPTASPEATIGSAVTFLKEHSGGRLQAVGIGSFGPVDLCPSSPTFGCITSTPKPGWQNYDFAGAVRKALGVPVGFDTDVDASALGEARWGAAQSVSDFLYLTVGTGIGGGVIVNGQILHGLIHPEVGNGYVRSKELIENVDHYVVPPKLGNRAGIAGALVLAEQAYQEQQTRAAIAAHSEPMR